LAVLDFRRATPPRYQLTHRQRLLALLVVVVLGLVLGVSRDWSQLNWLFQPPPDRTKGTQKDVVIDTRVAEKPQPSEIPGTFLSPLPQERTPEKPAPSRYFRGVMASYLESVHDDCPFRESEKDAWFNLLDVLNKTDEATLQKASIGRVTFVQLFRQSEEYRGDLVTVRGVLRWAHRVTAPKNDCGIKNYYQTWITPDDNPGNVEAIYCLRLPQGFSTGKDLHEPVEVTGFYFKRWNYRAKDTLRNTPVILAQTINRQERMVLVNREEEGLGTVLAVIGGTAACGLIFAVLLNRWSGASKRRTGKTTESESVRTIP
jgi:hypothetical protein